MERIGGRVSELENGELGRARILGFELLGLPAVPLVVSDRLLESNQSQAGKLIVGLSEVGGGLDKHHFKCGSDVGLEEVPAEG